MVIWWSVSLTYPHCIPPLILQLPGFLTLSVHNAHPIELAPHTPSSSFSLPQALFPSPYFHWPLTVYPTLSFPISLALPPWLHASNNDLIINAYVCVFIHMDLLGYTVVTYINTHLNTMKTSVYMSVNLYHLFFYIPTTSFTDKLQFIDK